MSAATTSNPEARYFAGLMLWRPGKLRLQPRT
jgi:hypothetical protein